MTRSYADIDIEPVCWLWHNRIAFGKLTLIAGVPGIGKTFFVTYLAARCSTGEMFPDGARAPQCEVLIMTSEDGAGDTIAPRLQAQGANLRYVHHMDFVRMGERELYWTMTAYLDTLEAWLDEHPDCKLLVLDPISAFMGDVDSHKNAEVRAALGPLIKVIERRGVALVGLTHLAKGQARSVNRVIGSIAFIAAARAAWLVEWDPEADGRRLFLEIKNNLEHADGLAYTIVDGRVEWESGAITTTADDLSDPTHTTSRDEAEVWLRDALSTGPVASGKLETQAQRDGIAMRTLRRAKKALGVKSQKDGPGWVWCLPEQGIDLSGVADRGCVQEDFGDYSA